MNVSSQPLLYLGVPLPTYLPGFLTVYTPCLKLAMSLSHIPGCVKVGLCGCEHTQQGGRTAHTVQIVGQQYGDFGSTLSALLESLQQCHHVLIGFFGHSEKTAGKVFSGQLGGKHTLEIAEHSIILLCRYVGRVVVELIKDPDCLVDLGIGFVECGHDQLPGLNGGVVVPRGGVGKNMPSS